MEAPVIGSAAQPLFAFRGSVSSLFKIHLTNVILTILTLGVYRFWAKTRMRRYLWSHVEVAGDPLEYTGTAKELFLGFLVVFGAIILPLFILPSIVASFFAADAPWLQPVVGGLQTVLIGVLMPVAIYRARRYRLTRTRWRGIRGGQGGSALGYAARYVGYGLLQIVTLGGAVPYARARLAAYVVGNTHVGSTPLVFAGVARPMYRRFFQAMGWLVLGLVSAFLLVLVLTFAVTLALAWYHSAGGAMPSRDWMVGLGSVTGGIVGGLSVALAVYLAVSWYLAAEAIYFVQATSCAGLSFELATTPWRYVWLSLSNLVIVLATLGLGVPIAYMRLLRFFEKRLLVEGEVALIVIQQAADAGPRLGEGLADAFDVGAI